MKKIILLVLLMLFSYADAQKKNKKLDSTLRSMTKQKGLITTFHKSDIK
jgi:hypothetical protein